MTLTPIRHRIVKTIAPKIWREHDVYLTGKNRPIIEFLSKRAEKNLVGVELGVWKGFNAERMLQRLDIKKLYLVDPYLDYVESTGFVWEDHKKNEDIARNRLKKYESKIEFLIMTSSGAKDLIEDELDFVYIDADHSYSHVKEDIENYYPKLKPGRVLAGHDFYARFLGVVRAVMEFSNSRNLELLGDYHDWWVIKEEMLPTKTEIISG